VADSRLGKTIYAILRCRDCKAGSEADSRISFSKPAVCLVGIVFFGLFSVQSADAQASNSQRIVGTWVSTSYNIGLRITFNANGTFVSSGSYVSGRDTYDFNGSGGYFYNNILCLENIGNGVRLSDCYISDDGKSMVMKVDNRGGTFTFWLKKQ